jgi:hypothetical protein
MPTEETPEQFAAWKRGAGDYNVFIGPKSFRDPYPKGSPESSSYWDGWMDARDALDDSIKKILRSL